MSLQQGKAIRAQGVILREFHILLKSLDKSNNFRGLVRVISKRQEFLWAHEKFAGEY
jgi:hypothetical protein